MAIKTSSRVEENTSRIADKTEPKIALDVDASTKGEEYTSEEKSRAACIHSEKTGECLTLL